MDGEFGADMFFDWNDDNFVPTFLQSDSIITALQDPNLMEMFNFQTEVAPVNPFAVTDSIDEALSQVQLTDPTSWFSEEPSSATDFTFVPNPLPPPPNTSVHNGTQPSNSSSSPEGLTLEGEEGPPFLGQDVTQTGSNQFSDIQNENLLKLEDLHINGHQNLSNQLSVPDTIEINNFNGFNINQSSPNPALVQPNPIQVTPAIETYSSGVLAPPQNHISNSHSTWNSSGPQHTQFSSPMFAAQQHAPNYMQSLSTVQNQVSHSSGLQHIHNLQSQNSVTPVNSMYPRLQPHSDLATAFVTKPPIPYQQGCGPMLSEPAVPSAFALPNYSQQPNLFATSNSHGSGSSVPPSNQMFSSLYQNQSQNQNQGQYHHSQALMPNNQGQQSSALLQRWSEGLSNHFSKYNQRMNTPNLPPLSYTSSLVTEAPSSQLSLSGGANFAPGLRIQEEATIPKNGVWTSRDRENLQRTSSTTSQPSEAMRRILDMNPSRLVRRSVTAGPIQESHRTRRAPYEAPTRGRPPKRRYEEYFHREKWPKVYSEIGSAGKPSTSQQARHSPYSYQNAMPTNLPSAPRQFVNSAFDRIREERSFQ